MATKTNIFLILEGTCHQAFEFYSLVFRTPLGFSKTYGEMAEMNPVKEEDNNKIMYCCLSISKETLLLGCDYIADTSDPKVTPGTNMSISLAPDNEQEARRLYGELSEGGTIITPLEKSFFNSLYGRFKDKFGIDWIILFVFEKDLDFTNYYI